MAHDRVAQLLRQQTAIVLRQAPIVEDCHAPHLQAVVKRFYRDKIRQHHARAHHGKQHDAVSRGYQRRGLQDLFCHISVVGLPQPFLQTVHHGCCFWSLAAATRPTLRICI